MTYYRFAGFPSSLNDDPIVLIRDNLDSSGSWMPALDFIKINEMKP